MGSCLADRQDPKKREQSNTSQILSSDKHTLTGTESRLCKTFKSTIGLKSSSALQHKTKYNSCQEQEPKSGIPV